MRKNRPRVATLDEVRISRNGEDAIIEFIDETVASTHLKLGPEVQEMTDQIILDRFNAVILAQQQMAAEYEHIAVEVPPGSPQIKYFERSDQWVPRGSGIDPRATRYATHRQKVDFPAPGAPGT